MDDTAIKLIGTACRIIIDIAEGKRIDNIVLTQVRQALPASGQKLMDLGRALANGENVPEIVLRAADAATSIPGAGSSRTAQEFRAAALAARAGGEAEVERFVAQIGFMGTLVGLPTDIRRAMIAGAIGGVAESPL